MIVQNATTNSHRLFAQGPRLWGMDSVNARLKSLRERAVPRLTVRGMAELLDMPSSSYAAYESELKFKKPIIPLELAKRIADVLEQRGVQRSEVLALAGVTGDLAGFMAAPVKPAVDTWLLVTGAVAAGVWKANTEWPASDQYYVDFGKSDHPEGHRFAVRMEGKSMNRTIMDGSDLQCLYTKFSDISPQPGDLVIVERRNHDLIELTCKRLDRQGDQYVLRCESYEPEFQEPIFIGKPDRDSFVDDEVRVIGIVLSAKQDLAPRGLSERRYRSQ